MKTRIACFFLGLLWLGSACQQKKEAERSASNKPKVQVRFIAWEDSMFLADSPAAIAASLLRHPNLLKAYFQSPPEDAPALAKKLFDLAQNPALKAFYQQSKQVAFFGNGAWKKDLTEAFDRIQSEFPNAVVPTIYTVFTGFGGLGQFPSQHLLVQPGMMVLGLDYFMGKAGAYLPPDAYDYQLRRLSPAALPAQALLLYSQQFNAHQAKDQSLLADMIWYGKSYHFTKTVLPQTADSLMFGYSPQELKETNAFQDLIWEHFIAKQLLYQKGEFIKTKYLGERPKTVEIGPACPGAIGRWVGYQIVEHYAKKHSEQGLANLMQNNDAPKLLQASGYRGHP